MPHAETSTLSFATWLCVAIMTMTMLSYSLISLLQNTLSTERLALPSAIRLRSSTIDTSLWPWKSSHAMETLIHNMKLSAGGSHDALHDPPVQLFLQFKRSQDVREIQKIEKILGIKLVHHVPENAFVVYAPHGNRLMRIMETDPTLREVIHWVGRVKPEHKTTVNLNYVHHFTNASNSFDIHPANHGDPVANVSAALRNDINLYAILADRDLVDQSMIDEWKSQLSASSEGAMAETGFDIQRTSSSKLSVRISSPENAQRILEFLQQREQIMWIETVLPLRIHNGGSKAVIQAGDDTSFDLGSSAILYRNGITGKDQIVALGDTGIDHDMCFFHDPDVPTPIDKTNTGHRKIISYIRLKSNFDGVTYHADNKDSVDGHGTHVAGSIAGNILQSHANAPKLERFNGMAKDAKLVFMDLMADDSPTLLIPDDLAENYFPLGYNLGAKIQSNSWGCSVSTLITCFYDCNCQWTRSTQYGQKGETVPRSFCQTQFGTSRCCEACNQYNSQTQETDQFLHEHDDSVILFAAGNDGTASHLGTVTAPATSKNVIAVGASMNNNDALVESTSHEDYKVYLDALGFSSTSQCCAYVDTDKDKERYVKSLCCPSFKKAQYLQNADSYNQENVAPFSSRGPVASGNRFSPTVVSPGLKVQSMHSDGSLTTFQCGLGEPSLANDAAILTMQGTSMATPITAGAVALIRQYYTSGYYPTGEATTSDKMDPSGYLLKATLIHAGQSQSGEVVLDGNSVTKKLPSNPNNYNGYGLVQLDSALKLKTVLQPERAIEMYVYDKQEMKKTDQKTKLCFAQNGGGTSTEHVKVRGTMVWYDPPSPVNAAGSSIIINNLDLDGYLYDKVDKDAEYLKFFPGNGDQEGDDFNPVSQVRDITVTDGQKVVFIVTGIDLQQGPQNYALVITGPKGLSPLPLEDCPVDPVRPDRIRPITIPWEVVVFSILAIVCLIVIVILVALVIFFIYLRYRRAKSFAMSNAATNNNNNNHRVVGRQQYYSN